MSAIIRGIKPYYERALSPFLERIQRLGVSPSLVTLLGLLLIVLGSVFLYAGYRILAFFLLALGALADSIDGSLARRSGRESRFGAFLDSTVDRLADASPIVALGLRFASSGEVFSVFLAFLALVFSCSVSYARARAEGLGAGALGGLFERTERWVILLGGILLGLEELALGVIAVGSALTVAQRVYSARKALGGMG
ncbi:MAG: CDP-alcohol phosphatidyltransferase family protein [Aquificae bacterium]|nr:CDP-alcohol phosphatidyltransferase family protein [Aquificota bacterium]